ncbi:hypothetical protein [Actinacidiphila sp. bgisy145]|uniref:hypothetical protein n=1 Tax=Actinacidiphila sp. bgisy145 TaxID=3413792 RepID=UPI003EC07F14
MLTRPEDIRSARIGHGATAVLNVRTGRWVWLDEDSRRIWDAALAQRLPELVQEVAGTGLPVERAQQVVAGIVTELTEQGLLSQAPHPGRPRRRRFTSWRTA